MALDTWGREGGGKIASREKGKMPKKKLPPKENSFREGILKGGGKNRIPQRTN